MRLRASVAVSRLIIASYVRSGWAVGEPLMVLLLVAISSGGSDPKSPHPVAAYFFGLHGVDFLGVTALGAVIMVRRSIGVRSLVVLSRLESRTTYVLGMTLASAALRVPLLIFLVLLGVVTGRLPLEDLVAVPAAGLGLLANAVLVGALTVGLMAPFSGRRELLMAVAYGVLTLVPARDLPPLGQQAQAVLELPLWPVSVNYTAGSTAMGSPVELLAVVLVLAGALGICLAVGRRFAGRDLLLT